MRVKSLEMNDVTHMLDVCSTPLIFFQFLFVFRSPQAAGTLRRGNILQLALYSEAVRRHFGGSVSTVGYWILPKHQLLTIEGMLADDNEDIEYFPPSGRNIFREVCNSYTFRMDQLKKGIIEEGETLNLEDLDYYNSQETMGLYPLETEYQQPTIKGHPIGNDNITLKGGLV